MLQKIFIFTLAIASLLVCQVTTVQGIFATKKGEDGRDRVVVHDEAVIPTHTVTQTATETSIQTRTATAWQTHTVERHTVATPVPEVNAYHLSKHQALPKIDAEKVLLRREVIDVYIRNGTFTNMVKSGAKALLLHPLTICASSIVTIVVMLT